jgi:hypothetical protein
MPFLYNKISSILCLLKKFVFKLSERSSYKIIKYKNIEII